MQLARRRLWLGITNVGFWVLAACAGLSWLVICRTGAPGPRLLLGIGVGAIAAQAVFDFIGGVTLMPGPRPSVMTFLRGCLRGVLGHTFVLADVGFVSAISLRITGGIVGLGRRAKSLRPASWMSNLPRPELAAESSRCQWQIADALPARAFALILIWNLLGTFTGTLAFHLADRPLAIALLGHAGWMTLWAFASLLVLPAEEPEWNSGDWKMSEPG